MKRNKPIQIIFLLLCALPGLNGCISTAEDATECYWVEEERCEMRNRCYTNFDVDGCKYYYREQCRARDIEPAYTEKQLAKCLSQLQHFGDSSSECKDLAKLDQDQKLELCELDELAECRPLACEDFYPENTPSKDTEPADQETSNGLEP